MGKICPTRLSLTGRKNSGLLNDRTAMDAIPDNFENAGCEHIPQMYRLWVCLPLKSMSRHEEEGKQDD